MSYRCSFCKKQIKQGIPQMNIITKTKTKMEGSGLEIEEERIACPKCYKKKNEKKKSRKKKL